MNERPTRVYLAGPMRGIEHSNFPAFDAGAAWLREQGFEVFNPSEQDRVLGFDGDTPMPADTLAEVLTIDLTYVAKRADAVILLDPYVFGPARAALLKRVLRKSMPKAKFVNAAGRSVTLVVSDGPGIGRMPGPCRCSDIKALCHPDVQFATKEQALRPSGR